MSQTKSTHKKDSARVERGIVHGATPKSSWLRTDHTRQKNQQTKVNKTPRQDLT